MFCVGDKVEIDYHLLLGKDQVDRMKPAVICTVQRILGDGSLQVFRDDVSTKKLLPALEKSATGGGLPASDLKLHWPEFFYRVSSRVTSCVISNVASNVSSNVTSRVDSRVTSYRPTATCSH